MSTLDLRPPHGRGRTARAAAVVLGLSLRAAGAAAAQSAATPARPISLGDAVRLAARQSPSVEAARLRSQEAGVRVQQARAGLLPSVSSYVQQTGHTFNTATFGIDFPSPPGQPPLFRRTGQVEGPVNLLDIRGRVSQALFDPAARARVLAARTVAAASDVETATVAEAAGVAAATAYVRAERAEAQLEARGADSALAAELLNIARDQLQAGVGVVLDVTRARAQLAGARAQLIAARADRDRSRLELRRALALPLDAPLALADSLGITVSVEPEGAAVEEQVVVAQALRRRPELRVLDAQRAAAEGQTRAIRAERLPTVAAFGDEGVIGTSPAHLLDTYSWGVQLSVPLFDGRRRAARAEEQALVVRELDVRHRDVGQQIAVEVRAALLDLRAAREQVDAVRERQGLAEQELAQARERFRAGVAGNADVVAASLSLNAARTQLIDALTAYHGARVALARAEGSVTALP